MTPHERHIDDVLKQALPSAPRGQVEAALDRVHARLHSDSEPRVFAARDSRTSTPARAWLAVTRIAAAAAIVIAAIWGATSFRHPGVYAVLEAADGSMYRIAGGQHVPIHVGDRIAAQEIVRADGQTGAVLALADGSRVEMRSMSELSWDHATDGLKIRLDVGSIIVSAAKQPAGRLYVQTRDMTAAVTGTTSVVNAADDGSRVAAIEGEVGVREGTTERKLRPGQQVTTSATLATRPLINDIAWSRNDDMRAKILAIFNKNFTETSGPLQPVSYAASPAQGRAAAAAPQFEEASIRPCDPDNLPPTPPGARGGGANSFFMSPGRTYVLCMTLATIIRTAYGFGPYDLDYMTQGSGSIGPGGRGLSTGPVFGLGVEDGRRVRGGPDWIREERYTIEAVAEGAADAQAMSGPMLRALLEKRFQLKAHVETEQVPAFDLTVARRGLKIKPVDPATACEAGPPPGTPAVRVPKRLEDLRNGAKPNCGLSTQPNGPNQVIVGGAAPLDALNLPLGGALGRVRIINKTGITDRFNFLLEFVWDSNTPGERIVRPDPNDPAQTDAPRAATIFTAIEEQLGLKLEPTRSPRSFLVIDQIQRPSAN